MKYLSFSLWGDKPIYNVGAIKNSELWKEVYPDWQMVVYYDNTVPVDTINTLKFNGVECYNMSDKNLYGMFWRFFAVELPDSEYCSFRDCDSRISEREKKSVDEWVGSGKSLHVMRDHPYHGVPYGNDRLGILGGMWGIKSNTLPVVDMINKFITNKSLSYGSDQTFLKTIYSVLIDDRYTNDDFFEKKPFTINRIGGRFIGERIDEFNNPVGEDYKILLK